MWFLLGITQALAHPFGAEAVAHDLSVTIDRDTVRAVWGVDVPTPIILEDPHVSRGEAFGRTMREVRGTVQVLAEGRSVGMDAVAGEPYPSDSTSWVFPVALDAAREGAREVEWVFSNGTFSDLRGFHKFSLQLDDGLEVIDSSLLLRGAGGEFMWDASDRWREGEGYREVSVTVGERRWIDRVWRRHVEGRPATSGLLDGARLTPWQMWWTHPSVPWLPGLCVWGVAWLSSGREERLASRFAWTSLALAGLGMTLMAWWAPNAPEVGALVGCVGGGVLFWGRAPRSQGVGLGLFVAGLGAALGTFVGAAGTLVWMAVGLTVRPLGARSVSKVALVCGILWLGFRGWAIR